MCMSLKVKFQNIIKKKRTLYLSPQGPCCEIRRIPAGLTYIITFYNSMRLGKNAARIPTGSFPRHPRPVSYIVPTSTFSLSLYFIIPPTNNPYYNALAADSRLIFFSLAVISILFIGDIWSLCSLYNIFGGARLSERAEHTRDGVDTQTDQSSTLAL